MTYETIIQTIRELPVEQRKRIVLDILDSLTEGEPIKQHDILEFEGVGAHLRDDSIDAQEYVNRLRREWDDRP
ncbi:MAG TPA: hypothetical protein VHD90_17690 [Phototrophicaceae bacterium]|nr:hypothetical protein [Phototrophicaceae bacterium]